MPDPLPRLLSALRTAVPELDGTALAEALWLAARMADRQEGAGPGPVPHPPADPDRPTRAHPVPPADAGEHTRSATPAPAPAPRSGTPDTTPAARPLHERLPGSAAPIRGHAVAAPHAAGLPRPLELTRALRPWKRRWPEGRRAALDIDATVDGYARSGELIPVFKAAPERWFDLVLVVDRSPGMRVWAETVAEFTAVLDRLGAFRTLQVTDLTFAATGEPHAPGPLRAADGRRLVVVVSDCMADAWRRPEIWHLLREWAGAHPTAVLNPLPTKLWRRGGLNLPTTRFTPAAPGTHRSRVPVTPPPMLGPTGPTAPTGPAAPTGPTGPAAQSLATQSPATDVRGGQDGDGPWLPIPVLSLTPHSLGRWSRTLMRGDPEGCTAVLVPPTGRTTTGTARPRTTPLPPAELARRFLRTASPRAARLAVLCAPFDRLSLRLLHLIRERLVPDAAVADVAEVVTSGVFDVVERDGSGPGTAAGAGFGIVELVLPPDAQEVLREHLPAHEVWALHQALDHHIASRGNGRTRLPSVAHDGEGPRDLAAEKAAFARASRRTLELLGLAEPRPQGEPDPAPGEGDTATGTVLPPAPEPYIGHADLADALVRNLSRGTVRAAWITAEADVPGAGRTALALHAAHRLREDFPDGVFFVPLRSSGRHPVAPDAALQRLLGDLSDLSDLGTRTGRAPEPVRPGRDGFADLAAVSALHRALRGRRVLLVLDDVATEQIAHEFARELVDGLPEGCAVVLTTRATEGTPGRHMGVELPPLTGRDAARLLAVSGEGTGEPAEHGAWWPLTLRILGGAFGSRDPMVVPKAGRYAAEWRAAGGAESPAGAVRLWLTDLARGRATTLVGLSVAAAGEFTRDEAATVLRAEPERVAAELESLVREGLLEQPDPGRYAFPAVVEAELARLEGYEARREVARARIGPFYRRAAAALYRDRREGGALAERLRIRAVRAPRPEVWVPNALAFDGVDAETLLLLHEAGAAELHPEQFLRAARALHAATGPDPRGDGHGEVRAALVLALAEYAAGRPETAWEALQGVGPSRLESDPAAYGVAAPLLARTAWAVLPDGPRAAVARAEEALAYPWGDTAPETGDLLHLLAEALTALGEHERLLSVLVRLAGHCRDRGLRAGQARALVRTATTLLRLDRPAQAEAAARQALDLLDHLDRLGDGDPAAREDAWRLLRTARKDGASTVIAIDVAAGRGGRVPLREALFANRPLLENAPYRTRSFDDCLLLVADGDAPLGPLLRELAAALPGWGDGAPRPRGVPRLAVHRGPVGPDPATDLAVEYTRTMLRSAEFRRVADNYPDDAVLCVSPEAYETLEREEGAGAALTRELTAREVRGPSGEVVCVILVPRVDLSAYDAELLQLARLFNELDPEGRTLTGVLRRCLDVALTTRHPGLVDVRDLGDAEREVLQEEFAKALCDVLPFAPAPDGRTGGLVWERRQGTVPLRVRLSLDGPGATPFEAEAEGSACLVVFPDDRRARWSAGLVRAKEGPLAPGAVLWLHRDAPLPENVLLGLAPEDRAAVLARPDDVRRVAELFRRTPGRTVPATALRPLVRESAWEKEWVVRLAGAELRRDGLLLLAANARGRATAEALRQPVPRPGEYVCVPLVRRRPEHGGRPSVVVDGVAWVVAREEDERAPLTGGFPGLRTR
ncbi:NaeI family type II restriction endonuclease [Streptomyces roseoviridis]|uniref:NaeI family type II restriction endonuclease n=1 Tax=Streptomyces roseoviridis TaxID=67361 RepID=A0ABV5QUN5_9ACTN